MDPFEILSHDLWEKVLNLLEDPKDKLNLIGCNSVLEKAFQDKKVEWGFAAVLPLILQQSQKNLFVQMDLRKTFLHCRQVSFVCLQAVEKFVEDSWSSNFHPSRFDPIFSCFYLQSRQVRVLFDRIKDYPLDAKCPIPNRNLSVGCDGRSERNHIPTPLQIMGLMERIGRNLLSLRLYVFNFPDMDNLAEFLQTFLRLLPNLIHLEYSISINPPPGGPLPGLPNAVIVLPELPRLKHFECTYTLHAGADLTPQIRTSSLWFQLYFPQLTSLQIHYPLWVENFNLAQGLFPNLQYFFLEEINILEEEVIRSLTELFFNLDAPQLKLVTMQITFRTSHQTAEKNVKFVETMGRLLLVRRQPEKRWRSRSGTYMQFLRVVKIMKVKIYDSSKIEIGPIKNLTRRRRQPPQQQEQRRGMCAIV